MTVRFLILALLFSCQTRAASCCGGGLSLPGVIVGDDQKLFSLTTSASQLREESLTTGEWSTYPQPRTSQSLQLSFAQLLSDRWQTGGSIQLIHNDQDVTGTNRGDFTFGDSSFFLGYEVLSEWEYSPWRPRGYAYVQMVAPTGRSTTAALRNGGGVSGRGFWTIGPGLILTKVFGKWDTVFSAEIHNSFPRTEGSVRLLPDWGASAMTGVGYQWGVFRVTSSVTWNYEGPVRADSLPGSLQRLVTASFGGSYAISDEIAFAMTYSDQTLLGEPINAPLNRALTVALSKRWPR